MGRRESREIERRVARASELHFAIVHRGRGFEGVQGELRRAFTTAGRASAGRSRELIVVACRLGLLWAREFRRPAHALMFYRRSEALGDSPSYMEPSQFTLVNALTFAPSDYRGLVDQLLSDVHPGSPGAEVELASRRGDFLAEIGRSDEAVDQMLLAARASARGERTKASQGVRFAELAKIANRVASTPNISRRDRVYYLRIGADALDRAANLMNQDAPDNHRVTLMLAMAEYEAVHGSFDRSGRLISNARELVLSRGFGPDPLRRAEERIRHLLQ